jgi:hypothetical protein
MKDRGSRFQLFFVHQEQIYPRSKLSELINTECLSMEAPLSTMTRIYYRT